MEGLRYWLSGKLLTMAVRILPDAELRRKFNRSLVITMQDMNS